MHSPLEFSLGFVAIEVSFWRCTELLPKVSKKYVRAEAVVGKISPTYTIRPEISLDMCFLPEFSLGFVAIEVSLWHCTELLPKVSPVFFAEAIVGESSPAYATLHEVSIGFVMIELFLRSIVGLVVCATRLTRMPAGYVTGVVQGH